MPDQRNRSHPVFEPMIMRAFEALRRSRDLLGVPLPDTFLGRPSHEPLPQTRRSRDIQQRLASKELQPPKQGRLGGSASSGEDVSSR
jgi:hypothetical protein